MVSKCVSLTLLFPLLCTPFSAQMQHNFMDQALIHPKSTPSKLSVYPFSPRLVLVVKQLVRPANLTPGYTSWAFWVSHTTGLKGCAMHGIQCTCNTKDSINYTCICVNNINIFIFVWKMGVLKLVRVHRVAVVWLLDHNRFLIKVVNQMLQ